MQNHKKFKRLLRLLSKNGQTRISRESMPNGFLLKDVVWFGDAGSEQTVVSRGFIIVPAERSALDDDAQLDTIERLRVLLATCGEEYTIQCKLLICSDYLAELNSYKEKTDSIPDTFRWQIWNRTERHARYMEAMNQGKLRREIMAVFFTKVIDSSPGFNLSENAMSDHFERIAVREALAFEDVQGAALKTIFPDCLVRTMTDREHFLYYYRFLNPNVGAAVPDWALKGYNGALSIQDNCMFSDLVQPNVPGISFQMDGLNQAIMVMRELPHRSGPGIISRLTDLGFTNFELTINLYPQNSSRVIKEFGKKANQLQGEVATQPKSKWSLNTQLEMAKERIELLERGIAQPFKILLTLRLWDVDPNVVISRATVARNAFVSMFGSLCHWATNAETARQLWFQTWPGWTFGTYRGYDLDSDDQTAAELLPWSASFTGRLHDAEALYDSPTGGLVGITTQIGRVPQHMLIFGQIGAGKSILLSDLWAQIAHLFGYILVVEEGLSHGTTVQTSGSNPIVIMAGGSVTINYLDPCGIPITSEQIGSAVALCLQMLRENIGENVDHSRVSEIQGILTKHINLLYDSAWKDWSIAHPEEAIEISKRAYGISEHMKTMAGHGNTFLDAWIDARDSGLVFEADDNEAAKFSTHPSTRSIVRDLGFAYMSPEDMPTHSQLVELLTLTPIGGYDDNQEAVKIGDRLSVWKANGVYGKLFDGITTERLDSNITHFELGLIKDSMEELRAAAHFLVLNYARQQVVKRPRAERKFLVFEEGARLISMPGGAKVLAEVYGQMRKYGAVCCTVFQQIAALEAAPAEIRAAVLDNSKLVLVSAQPSPRAAEAIGKALELTDSAIQTIKRYPLPEDQPAGKKFSSFMMVSPASRFKLAGSFRNVASREVVYCGSSDNETFDNRQKALLKYDDVITGILEESKK